MNWTHSHSNLRVKIISALRSTIVEYYANLPVMRSLGWFFWDEKELMCRNNGIYEGKLLYLWVVCPCPCLSLYIYGEIFFLGKYRVFIRWLSVIQKFVNLQTAIQATQRGRERERNRDCLGFCGITVAGFFYWEF